MNNEIHPPKLSLESKVFVKTVKKILLSFVLLAVVGMLTSLCIKLNVGVGPWDAIAVTVSYIIGIKNGTVNIIFSLFCVVLQIIILKGHIKIPIILQSIAIIITGIVINIFTYDVFSNFNITNYFFRLILFFITLPLLAFTIGLLVKINLFYYPVEGLSYELGKVLNIHYARIRQVIDFICTTLIILFTFIFKISLTVREGSIIFLLLYGPLLKFFEPYFQIILKKCKIL